MKVYDVVLTGAQVAAGRVCTITRRDGQVIRVTEMGAPNTIAVGINSYLVVPGFEISAIRHTIGGETPSLQLAGLHAVGGTFDTEDIAKNLFDGATVEVYVINLENPVLLGLLFTGTIQAQTYTLDGPFTFEVKGLGTKATGLFVPKFAPMCRTDLFSSLCGLDASDFDQAGTVGSIVNNHNITVSGLGAPPADGYFDQGVAVSAGGVAFDIASWVQSTTLLTSYLEIHRLVEVGEGLTLYPGCDKTTGAGGCGKFSNWINFQGEPHFLGAAAASASG